MVSSFWPEPKRRAWVVTTLAAGYATASSVPFVIDLMHARGDVGALQTPLEGWRQQHATRTCAMFQGYLIADLAVGTVHYRDQINLLTGWIHHVVRIHLFALSRWLTALQVYIVLMQCKSLEIRIFRH
jgi:hypothetical protein